MRALIVLLALLSILFVLSGACSKESHEQQSAAASRGQTMTQESGETVMAVKVNGRVVTEQEVAQEVTRLVQQLAGRVPVQQLDAMKDAIRQRAVDNVINRVLLEQAVENEKVEVGKDDVEARLDEIKQNFESQDAFEERLSSLGLTEKQLREEIELGMRIEALLDKHTANVSEATDGEISEFYNSNIERFKQPERVRASHILIAVDENDTEEQKAEKRLRAAKILGELEKGADFAQLASQYSDCPSKANGGDLGYFERGRMVEPFEEAAFNLKVGELSDIVETRYGYHIIKVTDHVDSQTIPLEEARADIASYINTQKKQEAIGAYVESLRAAATIEYPESDTASQ